MSGCVSNTTLPSQNLGTLLTPIETSQNAKPSEALKTKQSAEKTPSPPTVAEAKTPEGNLSPAVRSALVPDQKPASPAESATKAVAENAVPTPATKTEPTAPATQVAKLQPAKKPAAKAAITNPAVKKKPQTSLFGSFFKANQAGSSRVKSGSTVTTSRKPRPRVVAKLRNRRSGNALPGVRKDAIFGIETDEVDELDEPVRVASVTNLARRGTHGLLLQRKDVKVGCFPRKLVRLLKQVERRFGRTPIVTSGYRSKSYNRRIRGARNSMHIYCKAADIQVKGVSKWKLAKYLRSLPGRGGVGTYCHTKSVHIDIAGKRDWNRRCRRSRRRRS